MSPELHTKKPKHQPHCRALQGYVCCCVNKAEPTSSELIAWLEGLQKVSQLFTLDNTEIQTQWRIHAIIERLKWVEGFERSKPLRGSDD